MIEAIAAISDDVERMKAAHGLLRQIQSVHPQVADIRRDAVLRLHDARGWTDEQIGDELGVTKVQVGRIRGAALAPDVAEGRGLARENDEPEAADE